METKMKLTAKEEEIMNLFWERGSQFVREILDSYSDPKPHFNTISTIVRGLEERGFLSHRSFGNTYQYYSVLSREEFGKGTLKSVINKYYNNSVMDVVSKMVDSEEISLEDLKILIKRVENQK